MKAFSRSRTSWICNFLKLVASRDNGTQSFKIQSTTDQFQFVPDEVNVIIHECIEEIIGKEKYDVSKQEQWNNRIMESILGRISAFKKPYKYIVQCTTVQRTGAIVDVANACYWDTDADGSVTVRWENPYMYAIVSLFGIFI